MIIELNINLNIIGSRNALFECDARAKLASQYLLKHFTNAAFDRVQRQVEGDDGMLHDEDVLVASVLTSNTAPDRAAQLVFELSERLEQHCIAVYVPHANKGLHVGPLADQWPAFDLAKFYRWSYAGKNALRINNSSNKFANAH